MIPLDLHTGLDNRIVFVRHLSKSGVITTDVGEEIVAPPSRVRRLINYYKTNSFKTPIPMSLLYINGGISDVETYPYTQKHDVEVDEEGKTSYKYADNWKPVMAYRIKSIRKSAEEVEEKHGTTEWFCDGIQIYCLLDRQHQIDKAGNWFIQDCLQIPVTHFQIECRSDRLGEMKAIKYVTTCGTKEQAICVGNTAVIQTALTNAKKRKGMSFDGLSSKVTPSLAYLMRAAITWSEIFGEQVMEDIEVHKLLVHFRTCNLVSIPAEVRQSCSTGLSYQGMLARAMGLASHARDLEEAKNLQMLVQSLLSDGYVWKEALADKNIYVNKEASLPQLMDTTKVLSQLSDVRTAHRKRQTG